MYEMMDFSLSQTFAISKVNIWSGTIAVPDIRCAFLDSRMDMIESSESEPSNKSEMWVQVIFVTCFFRFR